MKYLNPEPAPLAVRLVLPGLLVLIAMAFMLVPTANFVFGRIHIMLPLVFVFHWTIFRAEGVHWGVIILLGLFLDLWSEAIVGLSSLMLVGFQQIVFSLRDDLHDLQFEGRWAAFGFLSAIYFALFTALTALVFGVDGSHEDLIGRWLLCCGAYPAVILAFAFLERRVLYPRRRA